MKKLCSGLMAIVLSLCQVCSTCSAEGNAEYNESYSRYLSKSSKKDKEDCKGTDDKQKKINLIISSIFLPSINSLIVWSVVLAFLTRALV